MRIPEFLRRPNKEKDPELWYLHVVMVSVLFVYQLVWILWDPREGIAWTYTWVWIATIGVGLLVEVALRLRRRKRRRAVGTPLKAAARG